MKDRDRELREHRTGSQHDAWTGRERDERFRGQPAPSRQGFERGDGRDGTARDFAGEESWSRPGTGESMSGYGSERSVGSRGFDDDQDALRSREMNLQDRGYSSFGRSSFESQGSFASNRPGMREGGSFERSSSGRFGSGTDRGDFGRGDFGRSDFGRSEWGSSSTGSLHGTGGDFGRREMGERGMQSGPHVGRGPKNYQRSDERLTDEICDRLTQHPHIDASEVEVEVKQGEVILRGTVEDRRAKHEIEDLVDGILGVRDIRNELRVERSSSWMSGVFGRDERSRGSRAGHPGESSQESERMRSSSIAGNPNDERSQHAGSSTGHEVGAGKGAASAEPGSTQPTGLGSRKEQ